MTDVAAVGSLPMYNGWANYSGLSNLYDADLMGSSIFNGYMMPFMPGGGINYDKYFNQMNDYLNFTSDYSLNMVENQRRNELRLNAADESIRNAAAILNEKIADNEQQQIMLAYRAYLEAVAAKYPGESERNIIARAKTDYQRLYNTSISDDIRKYGHNSFTHGLFNGLTFGLYGKTTPEENISKITGQPVSRWEKFKEIGGNATGGAAVAGVGLFAAKHLGWLAKVPKIGWLYAGIVGASAAFSAIMGSRK